MDPFELMLNQLCQLVIRLEGLMTEGLVVDARQLVVDTPGMGVLMGLDLFGPLRPGAVAAVLAMSSGGTTKRISRLEALGLVTRRHGAVSDDRRAVLVELTATGRDAIRGFDRLVVAEAPAWVEALAPLTGAPGDGAAAAGPDAVPDPVPGVSAPASVALFHLVGTLDQAVIDAVGELDILHPSDPRPLLLLSELDLHGPVPVGAAAALLARSRVSTNALLGDLADAGLVHREPGPLDGDRRNVLASVTAKGRRTVRRVTSSLRSWEASLRPLADAFVVAATHPVR